MKKDTSKLHDILVREERAKLQKYSACLLEPDHDRTLVLTAHVVAERMLEDMIATRLEHPQVWLREADFRSKTNLARALGLIRERELNICGVLNKARNAMAHTLEPLQEKSRKEMERLAYGKGSGLTWKKDVSKDLNQVLRVLMAYLAAPLLQAKFRTHLQKLRNDHRERWHSLWVEKMLANMDGFGDSATEEKLAQEVDLIIAKELQRANAGSDSS